MQYPLKAIRTQYVSWYCYFTVVTGMINTEMCRVGEIATVASYETTITAIDIHTKDRKPNNAAYATEHVGLGLRGISKDQIKKEDIVKIKNRNKFQMNY